MGYTIRGLTFFWVLFLMLIFRNHSTGMYLYLTFNFVRLALLDYFYSYCCWTRFITSLLSSYNFYTRPLFYWIVLDVGIRLSKIQKSIKKLRYTFIN